MPKTSVSRPLDALPETFVSDARTSAAVSRAVAAGRLRKLASRLYTRNLTDPPEAVVRRNLWPIVAGYFPGALIADRTALENVPAPDGSVCLITSRGRNIRLPGVTLRPRRGVGPLSSDRPFLEDLFLCSRARAFVENMRPSRARGGLFRRTLSRMEIEERLDAAVRRSGDAELGRLRDEARAVAREGGFIAEVVAFDALAGAFLGTREVRVHAPVAMARRRGRPYDPDRQALFEALFAALRDHPPFPRVAPRRGPESHATLAFFEAYFSNFIEGTEFAVAEAADIVFRGVVPDQRPEDAHDVLGTWRVVSDGGEMRRTADTPHAFRTLLRSRHAAVMAGRPGTGPGEFKKSPNRAGLTIFVAPDLVTGALERGFDLARSLETPFQRAVFLHFLVSEVHPFADGNGRMARITMNAELVAGGEERIVIPTIYRDNYLAALRALSQNGICEPLIRMLDYAQRWTAAVDWRSVAETERELSALNAFVDSRAADDDGRRLRMPGSG